MKEQNSRTHSGNCLSEKGRSLAGSENRAGVGGETCKFRGKRKGENIFRGFSLVCAYCYHFKGKKHCISGDFFLEGAFGSFKNFKTFHVKAFFFLKEIHNFGSQGCSGLGRSAVVYILLLYGFIYLFFYCADQLEDFFFSKCQLGFILFFFSFFLSSNISVVLLSIGNHRITPPSFGA